MKNDKQLIHVTFYLPNDVEGKKLRRRLGELSKTSDVSMSKIIMYSIVEGLPAVEVRLSHLRTGELEVAKKR
jgi:hypothetical protein